MDLNTWLIYFLAAVGLSLSRRRLRRVYDIARNRLCN